MKTTLDFQKSMIAETVTEVIMNCITNAALLGVGMAFSFALSFVLPSFEDAWKEITDKLLEQAQKVVDIAVKADVDISFIDERNKLMEANRKGRTFATQRLQYKTDLGTLCMMDGGPEAGLLAYLSNAAQYIDKMKAYCGASKPCVEASSALYLKSMVVPYSNALACIYHRTKDATALKSRGKAMLEDIKKLSTDFVKASNEVRGKSIKPDGKDPTVKPISAHFEAMGRRTDEKAVNEYIKDEMAAFEWLEFKAVMGDSLWTDCLKKYTSVAVELRGTDQNIGMLFRGGQGHSTKPLALMWKSKEDSKSKIYDEKVPSADEVDSRIEGIKKECGADNLFGLVVLERAGTVSDDGKLPMFERRRRLGQAKYTCAGYRILAVCGNKASTETPDPGKITFDDTQLDKIISSGLMSDDASGDLSPQAVTNYFNEYADDQKSLQDLVNDFGTQDWVRNMAQRDPAVLAYAHLGLQLIDATTQKEVAQIDHVDKALDETHGTEMKVLTDMNQKLNTYHGQEMTGLRSLENDMTRYHQAELKQYDSIDKSVAALSDTITTGFRDCDAKVDAVDAAVSGRLQSLNGLIGATAADTRRQVVSFLKETTAQTVALLGGLESNMNRVDSKTIEGVSAVRDLISQSQNQLRQNIASEFHRQEVALSNEVATSAQLVQQVGQRVLHALLYDVDAVHSALVTQLDGIGNKIDVVKGRLATVEKGFDDLQTQVDKMLTLLGSIQRRTNRIFRTLQNFPQEVAAILLQGEVKKRLDDYKKLNYAFTLYVENGMRPLYRAEMIQACDNYAKAGDLLYYFTSNAGVEGRDAVVNHFRRFKFNRPDYEKFGGQTIIAAYGVQRLSLTCAYLKEGLTREQYIERAGIWDREIDVSMYLFQMNVEETIPRYFLTDHYPRDVSVLKGYLEEARPVVAADASPYAFEAIEELRYRVQQDVGVFASVSVVNVKDASKLRLWTKLSYSPMTQSRQGVWREHDRSDLVILWSNTPKRIPEDFRELLKINLVADDVTSPEKIGAALKGTVLERYWAAGVIKTVLFTEPVVTSSNAKVCPWAISKTHYPYCWEIASLNGGCACVQIEGVLDTIALTSSTPDGKALLPTYYTVTTSFVNEKDPRSGFVSTASADAPTSPLPADVALGLPDNRKSVSACMTSALPPVQCDIPTRVGIRCHQPPPTFTRCVADNVQPYTIVYATGASNTTSNATDTFIPSGTTVTDAMFRTLELGANLPLISFFDEPNGAGNYVVCTNCDMAEFRTVFMFRIMSFKIGRPVQEKETLCHPHPRLPNVEYCPRGSTRPVLWTSQVLVETELMRYTAHVGRTLPPGLTDPQLIATLLNDGVQRLVHDDFSFFKVYVARNGSFNATTSKGAYWTTLPGHAASDDRGWTVVPDVYSTRDENDVDFVFDALVMWGTTPVQTRPFAKLVIDQKPAGQALKAYLDARFGAYQQEKILRGFFSEPFTGLDCPVAGDTDHFAYCTPTPVDKTCMCIQFEDLPEEYTEKYDGSAPNGRVVSFAVDADQSAFVVGRSKGPFSLGDRVPTASWDRQLRRNISDLAVCVSDYNRPELGASCVTQDALWYDLKQLSPRAPPSTEATSGPMQLGNALSVGAMVDTVTIDTETWRAQCKGCTGAFVSQMLQTGGSGAMLTMGGYVAGGECSNALADGGGVVTLCLK
ncbi:hypothetical protein PINS_up004335 [Pythium insidiosum]|nr:hypothetical protein PINS_up004335 [Pythium insidiosum]